MPHLRPSSSIHLIGIGGTGMSAIARVLLGQGYRVTGSDRAAGPLIAGLIEAGAHVHIGHDAGHVQGAAAVIVTSAAATDHVEVAAAAAAGIPVYKRADILADLTHGKRVVAVAGTAGKTTTTAMIAHMLIATGYDPSYILGGLLPSTGVNGGVGQGDIFVIEADEYDHMFLGLSPDVAIITNIVYDHPDFFATEADIAASFRAFADRIVSGGLLLAHGGDPGALALLRALAPDRGDRRLASYGLDDVDDVQITELRTVDGFPAFDLWLGPEQAAPVVVGLRVPGRHNALNAAAAIAALTLAGLANDGQALARALQTFTGADRRFQIMGERAGVVVVDDYAHHPLKIRAALQSARSRYPNHRIWAVWQPHTYSRTRHLWDDFATSFGDADQVVVTPIYAAREAPEPGIDHQAMAAAIAKQHQAVRAVDSLDAAIGQLRADVTGPAVIILLSAGDAPRIGHTFLEDAP